MYFEITRYYSPVQGQERYMYNKTYEQDVTMQCGAGAIGNDGCLQPSKGPQYTNADIGKVVACPSNYPPYTKFLIDGYGLVVCRDRGGAIKGNRLDLRMGIGMVGVNNIETIKRPAGKGVLVTQIIYP